jgi:hypothetical protein
MKKITRKKTITGKNWEVNLEVRAVPRLCVLYPGICFTTEEKHGKTSVRAVEKGPDIPAAVKLNQ